MKRCSLSFSVGCVLVLSGCSGLEEGGAGGGEGSRKKVFNSVQNTGGWGHPQLTYETLESLNAKF